jgi:hypothetical protein
MSDDTDTGRAPGASDDAASGEHLQGRAPVSGTELERVIHRATELQFARGEVPDALEEAEVLRIAEEVGLEGRYVRQALAELRADALLPGKPRDSGLAAKLWGEACIQASRVVPGDPHQVLSSLDAYLVDHESLTRVRVQHGRQVWEPSANLVAKLQRSLDFSGRGYELARARRVEVRAEPLEPGRCLVTLTADLSNRRAGYAAAWLAPALAVGLGAALGMHFGEGVSLFLSAPAALGPTAVLGSFAANRTYRRRRARVETALHGLLDGLEHGLPDARGHTSLSEKLAHWWEEVVE